MISKVAEKQRRSLPVVKYWYTGARTTGSCCDVRRRYNSSVCKFSAEMISQLTE